MCLLHLCNKWAKITDVRRRTFAWSCEKFKNLTWRLCRKTSEGLRVAWLLTIMFVLVFQVQRAIISEPKYYFDSSLFHFHCVGLFLCYQRSFLKFFKELFSRDCICKILLLRIQNMPLTNTKYASSGVCKMKFKNLFLCVLECILCLSHRIKFKEKIHPKISTFAHFMFAIKIPEGLPGEHFHNLLD